MESGWDPFGSGRPKNGSTEGWVDLTLGETSNRAHRSAEQEIHDDREERVSKSIPSSSASTSTSAPAADAAASKRSRVYNKGQQNVKCLVDDCDCDLRSCRDYHRRHRVCEVHSKTAVVSVKGKPQRFCQQCSRFHSLEEFDEFKRSCRRRLDGHNKRRRKPHPPPLYFASDYAGPRLLQYGAPAHDLYGNVNPYLSMWPVSHITGAEHTTFNRFTPILPKIDPQILLGPFANIQHPQEKQIPIMQPDMNELAEPSGLGMSVYEPLSGTSTVPAPQATSIATETASEDSCHKVPSDCALYLLSALQGHNSDYNYASMNCNVQFSAGKCLCSGSAIEEATAPSLTLDANMNTANNLPYNGMSRMGQEYGLMENGGSSLTFPFSFQ